MSVSIVITKQPEAPTGRWEKVDVDWWDSEYLGHHEFDAWHHDTGNAMYEQEQSQYGDGSVYWRPSNFRASYAWVLEAEIPPHAAGILVVLLEYLENHSDYWLYTSV